MVDSNQLKSTDTVELYLSGGRDKIAILGVETLSRVLLRFFGTRKYDKTNFDST